MKYKTKKSIIDMEQKVFDIKDDPMPKGAWWWWFWLFFIDNPENPKKPRQLMILWSTKNEKTINCNNLEVKFSHTGDRSRLDGIVAAWYFDGKKMHHNYLLEQCTLNVSQNQITSNSATPTSFATTKNRSTIKIGNDFEFIAKPKSKHDFTKPIYYSHTYPANKGYSIIKQYHMNITGKIKNKPIHGSAYFQRVFVNAPVIPWYWGVFHFENNSILTYFNPRLLGRSFKKDITYFDGTQTHEFIDINVKKSKENPPSFRISGQNRHEKISFTVCPYSHSSWTFKKKACKIIPNKLTYNEYPATISNLKLIDKKTGKNTISKDLGNSVGNAEYATGLLL